jgi:hypothetical protein
VTVYAWLWDHLPGPLPVRVLISVLAILAVVVICFWWIFPWVAERLPVDNFDQQQPSATAPRSYR